MRTFPSMVGGRAGVALVSVATFAGCQVLFGVEVPSEGKIGCGNGVVAEDEQCDDGNTNDGDLCSPQCLVTVPTGARKASCANGLPDGGVPVHVFDAEVLLSGDTTTAGSNATGTGALCGNGPGGPSPDVTFAVTAHKSGTLQAFVSANFDSMLYARTDSCASGTQRACDDVPGSGESISVLVSTGQTVWVVVDGFKDAATVSRPDCGAFQLALSIVDG